MYELNLRNVGRIAFANTIMASIALLAHLPIYTSRAVIPFTHSHSVPVESLGAASFFNWTLLAFGVYEVLAPCTSRLAQCGLALGVLGMLYMSFLHILFVFEVLWFSDSLVLFLIGGVPGVIWVLTIWNLTRPRQNRVPRNTALNFVLNVLSILAYPLWPILIWRRILKGVGNEYRYNSNVA